MKNIYKQLIESVGESVDREGLKNTPERASKAFTFLTKGYKESLPTIVNDAIFSSNSKGMITVENIEFYSLCEHHLLPFMGKCSVSYLPDGKVLGLSKVARIVDMYARRLQIQENLTEQIARAIEEVTNALGVIVEIEARHLCMMMRGVSKQQSSMKTRVTLGTLHAHKENK